ncbi:hypothetical protein [Methylomonas sp. MgM2]
MKTHDPSFPADDPDQLVIDQVKDPEHYLGNAQVVHKFVGDFANEVISTYDQFLAGTKPTDQVQQEINVIIKRYRDALMGEDPNWEIAPWQGKRLRGKCRAWVPMHGLDDPIEAFFHHLALQCVKAAMSIAAGKMSNEQIGQQLKRMLDDYRSRILGVKV